MQKAAGIITNGGSINIPATEVVASVTTGIAAVIFSRVIFRHPKTSVYFLQKVYDA